MRDKFLWKVMGKMALAIFIGGFVGSWIGEPHGPTIGSIVGFGLCLVLYFLEKRRQRKAK